MYSELTPARERLHSLIVWGVVFAMLGVTLYGVCGGEMALLLPWHSGAEQPQPSNLVFAATEADRDFLARMDARARLSADLLAGRLTLLEAAKRCRDLDRHSPSFNLQRFRKFARGATDEERYCRLVISGAEVLQALTHDADSLVVSALQAELAQRQREGTLRFP